MTATPFGTVLIANRGEIARRVILTARAMGLRTVAVFTGPDAGALHVREADRAAPVASYLSPEAILAAARATGAQAVHPGYGFLSENAGFARAVLEAGLVWVGPRPETIALMGDKAAARRAMADAGLPVLPGHDGEDQSDAALARAADGVGFPLMVKAVAGGGGRGMRLVVEPDGLPAALRAARAEARGAFGDDRLLLERAVPDARHVEIQVFGDRHGNAVHLGERDCSVQRRHQKLVEEAPSPALTPALRDRLGAACAAAARSVGYEGAGTFEFLLDGQGGWHFLEVNARLQVEHPVTEALTGLDLVEWQIRVAMGEPLPLAQDAIRFEGHAIEVRLCAEAGPDHLPRTGRILGWEMPAGLRVDAGVEAGSDIPPDYDSLIAKLVAHGPTRAAALEALRDGLDRAVVLGVATNLGTLGRILAHPVFAAGGATTGFLASHGAELAPDPGEATRIAAALIRATDPFAVPPRPPQPAFAAPVRLSLDGTVHAAAVQAADDGTLTATDADGTSRLRLTGPDTASLLADPPGRVAFLRDGGRLHMLWRGEGIEARDLSHLPAIRAAGAAADTLVAPMAGRVAAVHAAPGDPVAPGQVLAVLEAMKMEHDLSLPAGGTVAEVFAAPGDQVAPGQVLMRLGPA